MKVILHGILAERYGREHQIQTDVVADAIEGLSRQLPGWPRDLAIDVPGYGSETLLYSQTDDEVIHLVPRMFGGGGKWGSIIIGVALIALAVLLPPIGLTASLTLNTMLFAAGATMVMSGIAQLFMKAPTIDKSSDPPASKYLGVNKNTTAIGTLEPLGWGTMKLAGHWLSIQADSNRLVTTSFPATTS